MPGKRLIPESTKKKELWCELHLRHQNKLFCFSYAVLLFVVEWRQNITNLAQIIRDVFHQSCRDPLFGIYTVIIFLQLVPRRFRNWLSIHTNFYFVLRMGNRMEAIKLSINFSRVLSEVTKIAQVVQR